MQSPTREASYARLTPLTPKPAAGDDEGHFWLWTGIGALTGAVVGGIWAGVEVSHEETSSFRRLRSSPELGSALSPAASSERSAIYRAQRAPTLIAPRT
jgi:hypothetical protein